MMTREQILTAGGVLQPHDTARAADAAGLELAAAAALLFMESGGGRNVWGSDPVATGGYYTKGAPVTQADYQAYQAHRANIGAQGVGPCQLTAPGLQDAADAAGGCWNPEANMNVGFAHLAALIKAGGERTGFRAYNGSGAAAEAYADKAMALLATWRARLAGATDTPEDDMPLTDADVQKIAQATTAAVLAALIPDYAKDPSGQTPIALGISEAWEATHVGQLLDRVNAIARKVGA